MNSGDLSIEQLDALREQISAQSARLRALQERIRQLHFPYDDELRQRVERASDALHGLWVAVHYMSCNAGAGRKPARKADSVPQFRIQVIISEGHPWAAVEDMELVEAETALEALAKLARQGRLSPFDTFSARIVLDVDASGQPSSTITMPLTRAITSPYRR